MTVFARMSRPAVAGAALACAAALAGCGHSTTPAAAPSKTATVTSPTPVSTSASPAATSPAATSPAATSPAAPSGPAPCATRDLGLKLGLAQGTAGSVYQVLDFTNISNVSCTLYGYPGVSLGAGHPVTQVGLAAAENPSPPRRLVTLAPGQAGNALLRIVDAGNFPSSTCGPVKTQWIQVYPPNQTTPVYLSYHTMGCSKPVRILTVNVVVPGSGG